MTLRFPKVKDVPLAKSPLVEVVCQVRFPPILKITQTQPVDFQELIRDRFPLLEVEQGIRIDIPMVGSEARPGIETAETIYRFRSPSDPVVITLARDFFAASTEAYSGWPAFSETLRSLVVAINAAYRPAYATRIGLRYVNNLTMENTSASSLEDLVGFPRAELTALLRDNEWGTPESSLTETVFRDGIGALKFRSGFAQGDGGPALLLDFDYFEEGNMTLDSVPSRTMRYHDVIYSAFRWCVPEDRLEAFSPVSEEE